MSARLALKSKPRRGNAFRASRQVSENSEWFKKIEPGAQFLREKISSADQPCRSLRGSEAEPTTSSWRLRRATRHSRTNAVSPLGLRRPSAFGYDLRRGKSKSPFVSTPRTPSRISPSMRYALGRGSTANRKRIKGKKYPVHASALPFKENLLESQILTWAFTLTCTSDKFRFSWRSSLHRTPRMRTGPSLQRKGPGRVSLPLQAWSRKSSLLSKLTLAPAIRSYSLTAFFTVSISWRRDTKTVISSANAETLAVRWPAKRTPRRTGFVPSSLSLRSRGSKART